jgi:hypothetical protein
VYIPIYNPREQRPGQEQQVSRQFLGSSRSGRVNPGRGRGQNTLEHLAAMSRAQPLRVKVLVVPVYKRHWMYHAWLEGELASGPAGLAEGDAWWRHGSTVQDKVQALTFRINQSVSIPVCHC